MIIKSFGFTRCGSGPFANSTGGRDKPENPVNTGTGGSGYRTCGTRRGRGTFKKMIYGTRRGGLRNPTGHQNFMPRTSLVQTDYSQDYEEEKEKNIKCWVYLLPSICYAIGFDKNSALKMNQWFPIIENRIFHFSFSKIWFMFCILNEFSVPMLIIFLYEK